MSQDTTKEDRERLETFEQQASLAQTGRSVLQSDVVRLLALGYEVPVIAEMFFRRGVEIGQRFAFQQTQQQQQQVVVEALPVSPGSSEDEPGGLYL